MGDETRIYHGRWRNAEYGEEYYAEVALATLPRDRWGALGLYPEDSKRLEKPEGWVWSAAVTLPPEGCKVVLNADHARLMKVEVSDADFNLLPQYSGDNSGVPESVRSLSSLLPCRVTLSSLRESAEHLRRFVSEFSLAGSFHRKRSPRSRCDGYSCYFSQWPASIHMILESSRIPVLPNVHAVANHQPSPSISTGLASHAGMQRPRSARDRVDTTESRETA